MILASRIFAIVSGIILCISIFGIPFGILNFIAAKKLADVESGVLEPSAARGWSIYLIFTTTIGGVLALIGLSDLERNDNSGVSLERKLNELESLYDRGLISRDEYDRRRKYIIESV